MIEFIADAHMIADWDDFHRGAPMVLLDVTGFEDEQGPQLSLSIHDGKTVDHDGRPVERICFSVNNPNQIQSFFRAVEEARRRLPPNIVD